MTSIDVSPSSLSSAVMFPGRLLAFLAMQIAAAYGVRAVLKLKAPPSSTPGFGGCAQPAIPSNQSHVSMTAMCLIFVSFPAAACFSGG
jgi:hypothetical protein